MENLQKTMQSTKPIIDMSREEFNYTQKPIGKAIYKHSINSQPGRPKKPEGTKVKPTDRIVCESCGKEYFRSGSTCHKRTVYHQERQRINKKLQELLID